MNSPTLSCVCVFTEKVTEIKTNIFVTSFGPVSDTEMVTGSFLTTRLLKLEDA